jgi:hypothetical protein
MRFPLKRARLPAAGRIAALCLPCWAGSVAAADYAVDGDFALGQLYNSNIVLADRADGVFGTRLDAGARLAAKEDAWAIDGKVRLNSRFFYPVSGIDMTNVYLDADAVYFTERSRWSLTGNFTDAWNLASEAQPPEVTGFVLTRLHRRLQSLAPAWTYALDETTTATLGYAYSHAEYEFSGGDASVQDAHTASSELARRLDEQWSASLALSYSDYATTPESGRYSTRSESLNALLGLRYAVDDTLEVEVAAGAQYSRTESARDVLLGYRPVSLEPPRFVPVVESLASRSTAPLAPLFSVTARKRFETLELGLSYSRQISPSFNGLLLETDRVALTGRHSFTETLDGRLALAYYTQGHSGAGGESIADYSSYSLDSALGWRWSPNWSATASYQYLRREATAAAPARDSHAVFLSIRYDFDGQVF